MHKILWDSEIHIDPSIPARRSDLVLINKKKKKNLSSCEFCLSNGHQSENKRKWIDWQILGSCQRAENG